MTKVFISHTTRDQRDHALAFKLANGLRERGSQVWIAPEDIPVGSEWKREIVAAIMRECSHFLIILSAASTNARWVIEEIKLARERRQNDACFTILPLVVGQLGAFPNSDFVAQFQVVPYCHEFSDQLKALAKALYLRPGIPDRYTQLTDGFVGREYVYTALDQFLQDHTNGCFTVVGDPGEGKSAILAEYVRRTGHVAHFNVRAEGTNRPAQCLSSVHAQLTARYGFTLAGPPANTSDYGRFWEELLKAASSRLGKGERLVIAIDALDEVELARHQPGTNVLCLPRYLPKDVYLVMTRRRVQVPFVNNSVQHIFDLINHRDQSLRDIKTFIRRAAARGGIKKWMRTANVRTAEFVDKLAEKSECNFMYLHYLLPEIEHGSYPDFNIDKLPVGLHGYYEDHWERMGMRADPLPREKIRIVYVLAEAKQPISRKLLCELSGQDALLAQRVIDEWRQFLHEQLVDDEICYSIYHTSFHDFLHRKEIVQSAGESTADVNAAIGKELLRGLLGEE